MAEDLYIGKKKYVLVFIAALTSGLAGGVIFGYANLKPMLVKEGFFHNQCPDSSPCPGQAQDLDNVFVAATTCFGAFVWPNGFVLDVYGPKVATCIGGLLYAIGAAMCVYAARVSAGIWLFPGLSLMSIAGPAVVFSCIHLSNLFPGRGSSVITLLNVMLDLSAVVFPLIHQGSLVYPGIVNLENAFIFLACVGIFIFMSSLLLTPVKSVPFGAGGDGDRPAELFLENHMHTMPYTEQIRTPYYVLGLLFTTLHLFRMHFYMDTVDDQLMYISPATAETYTSYFGFMLPVGGLIFGLAVGPTLDNLMRWKGITLLNVVATLVSVLSLVRVLELQVLTFGFWALYRVSLFSSMCAYHMDVFGVANFGRSWGLTEGIAGLSNLLITPIVNLTFQHLQGDFFWSNMMQLVITVLFFGFPLWLRTTGASGSQLTRMGRVSRFSIDPRSGNASGRSSTADEGAMYSALGSNPPVAPMGGRVTHLQETSTFDSTYDTWNLAPKV